MGRKMIRTKRSTAGERRASKMNYRTHKSQRKKHKRSAAGKRQAGIIAKIRNRLHMSADAQPDYRTNLTNLLEDVQDIVSHLDENNGEASIKSFANIAIISEMLGEFFGLLAENEDAQELDLTEELAGAADLFNGMAEDAAAIATALHEGVEDDESAPTYEEIEEAFQRHMDALIDGLELYADLTEDEDDGDEGNVEEGARGHKDPRFGKGIGGKKGKQSYMDTMKKKMTGMKK